MGIPHYQSHSFSLICLSLTLLIGCGETTPPAQPVIAGDSYCETINEVFYLALDRHLEKSRANQTEVYTGVLKKLVAARPLSKDATAKLSSELFSNGVANVNNLETCKDLALIWDAWTENPTYSANTGLQRGESERVEPEAFIYYHFLWALGANLDVYSRFQRNTLEDSHLYDFGVRFDVAPEQEYFVESLPSLRVLGVKDRTQNLVRGDKVVAVDWSAGHGNPRRVEVKDRTLDELLNFFSRNRASSMRVYVERTNKQGETEQLEVLLRGEKALFSQESAPLVTGYLQGNMLYVKLHSFRPSAAFQLLSFITQRRAEWTTKHRKDSDAHIEDDLAIILDLRFNSGGSVKECLQIAGMFLPPQVVGAVRSNSSTDAISTDLSETVFKNPLAILVNHASASAAEILPQILSETGRAVVLGERTFGKGIGQEVFDLSVGGKIKGSFSITTARFFGPSGENLQMTGLVPDVTDVSVKKYEQMKSILQNKCLSDQVPSKTLCIFHMSDWTTVAGKTAHIVEGSAPIASQATFKKSPTALRIAEVRRQSTAATFTDANLIQDDELTLEASKILLTTIRENKQKVMPAKESEPDIRF